MQTTKSIKPLMSIIAASQDLQTILYFAVWTYSQVADPETRPSLAEFLGQIINKSPEETLIETLDALSSVTVLWLNHLSNEEKDKITAILIKSLKRYHVSDLYKETIAKNLASL